MSTLTITPGKHYKTRDGSQARIYADDGARPFTIHGAIMGDLGWEYASWDSSGLFQCSRKSPQDIIAEWIDKPEVNWSVIPPSHKLVAMDESADWWSFEKAPAKGDSAWISFDSNFWEIHPELSPKWSGFWIGRKQ